MNKYEQHALDFAREYPGWHTYAQDLLTRGAINNLVRRGLVQVNQYQQFTLSIINASQLAVN